MLCTTKAYLGHGVKRVCLTPEQAKAILDEADAANVNPRRRAKNVVTNYATEMRAGRFACSTIYFDEAGILVDGQHRLAACVLANVPAWFWVVGGLTRDEVMGLDQGKKRGVAVYLEAANHANARTLQSAVALLNILLAGKRLNSRSVANNVSPQRAFEIVAQCPGIDECVRVASRCSPTAPASIIAAVGYWGEYRTAGELIYLPEFVEGIRSGAGLLAGDSRLHLRNRLISDRASKSRLTYTQRDALVVKAWNFFIRDTPCRNLRWAESGPGASEFPEIQTVEG
jgi:hypothetical protein